MRIGGSFKGVIDDVRIWDSALSLSAIQADRDVSGAAATLLASRLQLKRKSSQARHKQAAHRGKRHKKTTRRR